MQAISKRVLLCVFALVLVLGLCVTVSAVDAQQTATVVATNTVTLLSDSGGKSESVFYTPETSGILTVDMAEANPGWAFKLIYPDGSGTLLISGTAASTYEYEITADGTYEVQLYAYNKSLWSFGDGEISYTISFTPAELDQDVVTEEYVTSDTALVLGQNTVTLEPNAITTIFAFTPTETGTYTFTAAENQALLGYWGSGYHYLNDFTAEKSNTLEYTITSVGQSVMLGVSGVESANITVEKTADYQEVVIETIVYQNTHQFGTYTYDENALVEIDIFDDQADVAVLGNDGFYHYGSIYGPIMVINLKEFPIDINNAALHGQLSSYITDENGVTVKYDYNDAMVEYYNKGLYPVTEELARMLQEVGETRSWYEAGGFVYSYATSVDEEIGWMGVCYYVEGTEIIVPNLTMSYPTLSFEDTILYNVYYSVDDATSIVEMGLVTFTTRDAAGTIDTAWQVIPGYVTDGTIYMAQSNGIAAKDLGDALYFKVYAKLTDGSYVYTDVAGFNAIAYAKSVLNNANSSAKAKALVVAMLNYGAAAQEYFDYKTDSLMNATLTAEQQALVQAYDASMVADVVKADSSKVGDFLANGGYSNIWPTVSFEGAFAINFYFTPSNTVDSAPTMYYWDAATYNSVDELTIENATGELIMKQDGNNWGAAVEGIAAKQIDETVYVAGVYTSGSNVYITSVISYSLGAYCKNVAAQGTDFGAATAVYGYYAKAFFAN